MELKRAEFNKNMRCIETTMTAEEVNALFRFNKNMRCIETQIPEAALLLHKRLIRT